MTRTKVLNEVEPGYPDWPFIAEIEGTNEVIVYGDHVSYEDYSRQGTLTGLLIAIGAFYLVCCAAVGPHLTGTMKTVGTVFFIFAALVLILYWEYILPRFFNPCKTIIRFTPEGVIFDGKIYRFDANVEIRFQANRSPLSPAAYYAAQKRAQDTFGESAIYELEFRLIEMVYGGRIVRITTVNNEDRARQYAIALQLACERVTSHRTKMDIPSSGRTQQRRETLPE